MQNLRDFRPDLRAAIGSLHRAGYDGEAYVLAKSLEGAYTTALEMVQAIRAAVLRVDRTLGADLPGEARAALQGVLADVTRVMAALTLLDRSPPRAAGSFTARGVPVLTPASSG